MLRGKIIKLKYEIELLNVDDVITYQNLEETFENEMLFGDMLTFLKKKHNLNNTEIIVYNLMDYTWKKIFPQNMCDEIVDYDPKTFCNNFILKDMQRVFKFFNNTIVISEDYGGLGKILKIEEGIKFRLNPNEKDKHKHEPHVHCEYNGEEMRIRIDTLEVMKNDKEFKNKTKVKYAKNWVKQRRKYLLRYYKKYSVNNESITFEAIA